VLCTHRRWAGRRWRWPARPRAACRRVGTDAAAWLFPSRLRRAGRRCRGLRRRRAWGCGLGGGALRRGPPRRRAGARRACLGCRAAARSTSLWRGPGGGPPRTRLLLWAARLPASRSRPPAARAGRAADAHRVLAAAALRRIEDHLAEDAFDFRAVAAVAGDGHGDVPQVRDGSVLV